MVINLHPAVVVLWFSQRVLYIFLNWNYMPTAVRNVGVAIPNTYLNIDASLGLSPRLGLPRSQARPEPISSPCQGRALAGLERAGLSGLRA